MTDTKTTYIANLLADILAVAAGGIRSHRIRAIAVFPFA